MPTAGMPLTARPATSRAILTAGLTAGAIMGGMLVATLPFHETIGFEYGAIVGYASMVLAFCMVYVGLSRWRASLADGRATFGRAVLVALGMVAVATVVYVVTWELVYRFYLPDFMERYAEYALSQARAGGATEAELAAQAAEMASFAESYRNPLVRAAFTALEPLPVGALFALVSAWLVSRRGGSASTT